MAQFEAFDDDVEVNGQTVQSMIAGAGDVSSIFEDRMEETLADHGIEEPRTDEWYAQQAYLDAFESVADSIGQRTLTNIGKKIPDQADWPPGIDSVPEGLESINEAYQMNHRNGDIGYYEYEPMGDSEGKVFCKNPYPCAFDKGIVKAVVSRFSPESNLVTVSEEGDDCRQSGGDECVYHVSW